MGKENLTINIVESGKKYFLSKRADYERIRPPLLTPDFISLTENIYHEWKSERYSAIDIWAGEYENSGQTPHLRITEEGINVNGHFGQCEKMYELQKGLEKMLNQ